MPNKNLTKTFNVVVLLVLFLTSNLIFHNLTFQIEAKKETTGVPTLSKQEQFARFLANQLTSNHNFQEDQLILQTIKPVTNETLKTKFGIENVVSRKNTAYDTVRFLQLPENQNLTDQLEKIPRDSVVDFFQPVYEYKLLETSPHTPEDPEFNSQWQLQNGFPGIRMPTAWSFFGQAKSLVNCQNGACGGSPEIKVAIIDTGVNTNVTDFAGANFAPQSEWRSYYWASNTGVCSQNGDTYLGDWPDNQPGVICVGLGKQEDQNSHGTAVASVIAMQHNNFGGAGVAPKITILPIELRDCQRDNSGNCTEGKRSALNTFTIEKAIDHARESGARIINLSLGSYTFDPYLDRAINRFNQQGGIVIAAAGNDATNGNNRFYPAYSENTIAVGAITKNGTRAIYSTYHDKIDIVAPVDGIQQGGTDYMLVQNNNGDLLRVAGTSFATPQVTAVVAMMLSINPDITFFDIKENFLPQGWMTVDIGPLGKDDETGYGRLDAALAITKAADPETPTSCFLDVRFDHSFNRTICNLKKAQIISGYPDRTYRPSNNVTRGEMAKFIKNGANIPTNTSCEPFPDVQPGAPFYEEITSLKCAGIVLGYPVGNGVRHYRLNNSVTRGEMAAFIFRAFNIDNKTTDPSCEPFPDVQPGAPFYEEITSLKCAGIIRGYPINQTGTIRHYRPGNNVTRAEMSVFIDNARKYNNPN